MCGIVGYIGDKQAAPVLLSSLAKLEYRGYDSAGLAVRDGEKPAIVVKTTGKLNNLVEKTDEGKALSGNCGIGHTRWATHGAPSQINAHPHVSGNCTNSGSGEVESLVVGVHNGIIENYQELKAKMERHAYKFYSETDTEVLIKLVDYYYKKYKMGPIDALAKTIVRVRGSYALVVMFADHPGKIYVARKESPLIIGKGEGETFIASDVPAFLSHTRNVYYIGNLEMAEVTADDVTFYNLDGDAIEKEVTQIDWDAEAAEKEKQAQESAEAAAAAEAEAQAAADAGGNGCAPDVRGGVSGHDQPDGEKRDDRDSAAAYPDCQPFGSDGQG